MASGSRKTFIIEPLDTKKHDRAAFTCGVAQVDNFFKQTANKLATANNVRVFVMTTPDGDVIGFYAVNAHAIHYEELPTRFARGRPGHGMIPATYISMIGRDIKYAGGAYGGDLLADCLRRIAIASESVGVAIVLLDVLDCGDEVKTQRRIDLYKSYGFAALPSNPMKMFLPIETVKKLI